MLFEVLKSTKPFLIMRYSNKLPEVNTGSMADIAFLLLIFFLVSTTIPNEKGIARSIPQPSPPGADCNLKLMERNVLRLQLNEKGTLMVNEEVTPLSELQEVLIAFIDNNGDNSCSYCKGQQNIKSSENPSEANIALKVHTNTPYRNFIELQDELSKAYEHLRTMYANEVLKKDADNLTEEQIKILKEVYPFKLIEEVF